MTFAGTKPTPEQFAQLHEKTHERCFIANSVKIRNHPRTPHRLRAAMAENLIVEKRNLVAIVTLNRPEVRNAFDDVLIANLTKAFLELEKDETVRVVVLAGAGKAFCAGADLNWMKRMAGYGYEDNLKDANALADDAEDARPDVQADDRARARARLRRRRRPGRRLRHRHRLAGRRSSA